MKDKADYHLKGLILRTVEVYNRYRSPEATAKLVEIEKGGFTIEFKGLFCRSCGVNDYFKDFIYMIGDISKALKVELKAIESTGPESFRVRYIVKDHSSVASIYEQPLFRTFLKNIGLSLREYLTSNACTKDVIMFQFRTWLFERKSESKK